MGFVTHCQFPGCKIPKTIPRGLCSDHDHKDGKLSPSSYRGEICPGHNRLLHDLDQNPEWATEEQKAYMRQRPYKGDQNGVLIHQ